MNKIIFKKIISGLILLVLFVGAGLIAVNKQVNAHSIDSGYNFNNIDRENLENYYKERFELMEKYNLGSDIMMMNYSGMPCHN